MTSQTLYMSSYEHESFAEPRRIEQHAWVRLDRRNCLRVVVDIPVLGSRYDLPYGPINKFYLLHRYEEDTAKFRNLSAFPINVYVLLPKVAGEEAHSLSQVENVAWATLYDALDDARDHKI